MEKVDPDDPLNHWRQGDFAFNVGGFLYAIPAEGDEPYDASETTENIVGLVVISQTCDIVRRTGERHYLTVCPLIEKNKDDLTDILRGRKPNLADVENAGELVFADLNRIMSVHKDIVKTWDRNTGFNSEATRIKFAAALERKFGRFAFPDEFDSAMKEFNGRVWKRHKKDGSELGRVCRSLAQIRFRAEPNWEAYERTITVIAVLNEKNNREVEREHIGRVLDDEFDKIDLPEGYNWANQRLILETTKGLSAEDIIESRRGDFDFLCY